MVRKFILLTALLSACFAPAYAAKYAGEFLNLGVGARALGMGGAFVGIADDVTACFWNPAGLSQLSQWELSLMHAETFGSLLNQDFAAVAFPLRRAEENSAFAFSFHRLGGGGVKIPELDVNDTTRLVLLKEESHADYALFVSYSQQIRTELFGGASLKIIYRDLISVTALGVGADLAVLVKPYDFLTLGANLMDLTSSFLFYDNGTTETINPTTKLGAAVNHQIDDLSLILAADADLRYEGRKSVAQYWIGNISADVHYGAEVSYKKTLSGRLGFDQGEFTAGAGLWINQFDLDVAFLSHQELDNTYRISLLMRF